jgi:hypothetical protein
MIQIPAFLVFAVIIAALLLVGGLYSKLHNLGKRLTVLEVWRAEFEHVNAARMRAKNDAMKRLE